MKKPGDFKKQQQKHQNIQHNRDQLKLLREEKVEEAELFVLDPDGFKKVTIRRLSVLVDGKWIPFDPPGPNYFYLDNVVYLQRTSKHTKLRTGYLATKDAWPRCRVNGVFVEWEDVYGVVVKEEILKPNENK